MVEINGFVVSHKEKESYMKHRVYSYADISNRDRKAFYILGLNKKNTDEVMGGLNDDDKNRVLTINKIRLLI